MRESHTAILERHLRWEGAHFTEPYECAWAAEATFYVYATQPGPPLELTVESSVDGRRWLPHGSSGHLDQHQNGTRLPVRHIDGWLRLKVDGADLSAEYDIYLFLKE